LFLRAADEQKHFSCGCEEFVFNSKGLAMDPCGYCDREPSDPAAAPGAIAAPCTDEPAARRSGRANSYTPRESDPTINRSASTMMAPPRRGAPRGGRRVYPPRSPPFLSKWASTRPIAAQISRDTGSTPTAVITGF